MVVRVKSTNEKTDANAEGSAWRPASSRRLILDAARRKLCDQSFSEFAMEVVAEEAGVSRRTVYNQFANREELYCASRLELFEKIDLALAEIQFDPDQPVEQMLHRFCELGIAILLSPESLELRASRARDRLSFQWIEEQYTHRIDDPLRLKIEHFLLNLMLKGDIEQTDPAPLAESLLSAVNACVGDDGNAESNLKQPPVFTPKEIADIFVKRLPLKNSEPAS
ncbi:TetR/AcrR family transcriptional regulator [Sphingorhabdus sp. EL138]|uniref:TetR/AcrR family transcriptional regulator n=1 Tax=Sphingorhabdus sp. EL138 TaxID=2073156 RepID=UPI0013A58914|nr:TetR/AcrR family transcriptional regulator [Sphingorhabdus sp. EL138]